MENVIEKDWQINTFCANGGTGMKISICLNFAMFFSLCEYT